MNPVLILTHNCLELTKRCVESVRKQDVPVRILAIDNGSTDGTRDWLPDNSDEKADFHALRLQDNNGVSYGWNWGLKYFFETCSFDHCLVINNDTCLPAWFYSSLLSYDVSFVSGVSVGSMEEIANPEPRKELAPCPDFSAFLIRRDAWKKVGPFDETMVHYAGDNDWHIRAHRAGVTFWNSGVGFYHERSSTLRNSPPKERRMIEMQADADRMVFAEKHGFEVGSLQYAAAFDPEFFGVDKK